MDSSSHRAGFTLTEILIATALTVLMLGMVVQIFALVSDGVRETRGVVEVNDRLRAASSRLQLDLAGVTANLAKTPPLRPEDNEGYFEYIEGPVGPVIPPTAVVFANRAPLVAISDVDEIDNVTLRPGADGVNDPDTTVGDVDDVLMFTTRSNGAPFIGKFNGDPAQSQVAEVCWFLRGTTLYRRVLLVLPDRTIPEGDDQAPGFYADYDVSVRQFGGVHSRLPTPLNAANNVNARLIPNTLGDLTNRQNRYGHQPWAWPHDARFWGRLGLPTLRECTYRVIDVANPNTATMTRTPREFEWPFPLQHASTFYQNQGASPAGVAGPYNLDTSDRLIVPLWDRNPSTGNIITTVAGQFAIGTAAIPPVSPPLIGQIVSFVPTISLVQMDAWRTPHPWAQVDRVSGGIRAFSADPNPNSATVDGESTRTLDDVVLTNVLSFDVKIWDPGAPVFLATDQSGNLLGDNGRVISASTATVPPAVPSNAVLVTPSDIAYTYQFRNTPVTAPVPGGSITSVVQRLCDDIAPDNDIDNGWLAPVSSGAYVDLNYMCRINDNASLNNAGLPIDYDDARDRYRQWVVANVPPANQPAALALMPQPLFNWAGNSASRLAGQDAVSANTTLTTGAAAVYDTGSTSYEQDGLNQDYVMGTDEVADEGTNGQDDGGISGQADDLQEKEAPVPYAQPVRGIQIKIRVYDPDSRQIREVTVVQDFVK